MKSSRRGALVLALVWVIAGGCQNREQSIMKQESQSADWIFSGGTILTLDASGGDVEAVAVAAGRILRLGTREEMEGLRGANTRSLDLAGRVLMPAFIDHHLHLLNIGIALLWEEQPPEDFVFLYGLESETEIAERLAARAAELPAGSWILGQGWSQGAWGTGVLPDHRVLSRRVPNHPVFLTRVCAHAAWLNARALEIAGIERSSPDPEGGAILRDRGGNPTGVLLERAVEPVTALLPAPSDDTVKSAFRLAARRLAEQGVVEVFDAGFLAIPGIVDLSLDLERYLELLVEADAEEPLPIRVNLMIPGPSDLARQLTPDPGFERELSPRLRITHVKLFMDGALGNRGGLLSHPYADDPATHGVRRMTPSELRDETLRALDSGLDVATHAIGDQAVSDTLDVYGQILAERPDLDPARLRLEHFSYAAAGDFERAADTGIVLSVQPNFVLPDDGGHAMEDARLGSLESERAYAWQRLRSLGARLAFGSDYFTLPFAPLYTYYAAVTRKNATGLPAMGWHPDERLDRVTALEAATTLHPPGGGPPARGALAVGAPADLVVLSADPLSVEEERLLETKIEATFMGGKPTYRASTEE